MNPAAKRGPGKGLAQINDESIGHQRSTDVAFATFCPYACADPCPWRCPIALPSAVAEVLNGLRGAA